MNLKLKDPSVQGFMVSVEGKTLLIRNKDKAPKTRHYISYSSSEPIGFDNPLYDTFRENDRFNATSPIYADIIVREETAKRMVEFIKENPQVLKDSLYDTDTEDLNPQYHRVSIKIDE